MTGEQAPMPDRKHGPAMDPAASIFRQMRGKSDCLH
jgi:hypothetical protein